MNLADVASLEPAQKLLGEVIFELLTKDRDITDVHVASGEVLRVRYASNDWRVPQLNGGEMTVAHEQIVALCNGIYEDEEAPFLHERDAGGSLVMGPNNQPKMRKPRWLDELRVRGVLQPSKTLNDEIQVDGKTEFQSQRVRFTIQKQGMGDAIGIMARGLRAVPDSLSQLGLPPQVQRMIEGTAGLILVAGPTGSGKSTTLAALLSLLNAQRYANVVTLEDPVEYEFRNNRCFFNQREVGVDVESFEAGVRDAMRFAIDVLVIGEIRDAPTMRAALRAAESGHLVLATTHASSAVGGIRRMLAWLDSASDSISLSNSLIGVIAQALVPDKDESLTTKHLAFEVLFAGEPAVQKAVASGEAKDLAALDEQLRQGSLGTHNTAFRTTLTQLIKQGRIDPRRAATIVQDPVERDEFLGRTPAAGGSGGGRPFGASPLPRQRTGG